MSACGTKRTCKTALMNVRFEGNNGHGADVTRCLLMTRTRHASRTAIMPERRQFCRSSGLASSLASAGEAQHKEGHEVDGDQHQGQNGHQIAGRLNLKCVPRRRSQETQP